MSPDMRAILGLGQFGQMDDSVGEKLCADYVFHNEAALKLDTAIHDHFKPVVWEALMMGDSSHVEEVMRRIPDCVGKCFLWDFIRQHKAEIADRAR